MWFLKIIFSELFICRQILLSGVFWCSLVRPVVHMKSCHTILKAEKSAQSWCLVLLFFTCHFPWKMTWQSAASSRGQCEFISEAHFPVCVGTEMSLQFIHSSLSPFLSVSRFFTFFVILLIIWRSEQSCITDALSHSTCTENGDK